MNKDKSIRCAAASFMPSDRKEWEKIDAMSGRQRSEHLRFRRSVVAQAAKDLRRAAYVLALRRQWSNDHTVGKKYIPSEPHGAHKPKVRAAICDLTGFCPLFVERVLSGGYEWMREPLGDEAILKAAS